MEEKKKSEIENSKEKEETKNYIAEGMTIGMCFGMAIGSTIKKEEK